jgi:hypothetical protein
MSVLLNKPSQLSAATGSAVVSIDTVSLQSIVNGLTVQDRWKNSTNWKYVEFVYKNASNQHYKITFKLNQNKLTYTVDFPSTTRDGMFQCVDLNIAGYNADFLEIDRTQFTSLFGSVSVFDINVIEGYGYIAPPPIDPPEAPFITSIIPPTNGNYVTGEDILFTVIFSKPVYRWSAPSLTISRIGETSTYFTATYFSGEGTDTFVFRYNVDLSLSLTAPNGIEIRSPITPDGSLRDVPLFTPNSTAAILTFANIQLPLVTVNQTTVDFTFETHSSVNTSLYPEYFQQTYQVISQTPRSVFDDYYATIPVNPYANINQVYYDSSTPSYDIGKICAEVIRGIDKYVLEQIVLSSTSVKIRVHKISTGSNILSNSTVYKELIINNFQVPTFAYNNFLTRGENLVRSGGIVHFVDNSTSCIFLMAKYNGTVNDTRYFLHTTDFINWQYKKIQDPSNTIGPNVWTVQNWMSGRLLASVDGQYVMLVEQAEGMAIMHSSDGLFWQQRQYRDIPINSNPPYSDSNGLHRGLTSTSSYFEFRGVNQALNFETIIRLNKL